MGALIIPPYINRDPDHFVTDFSEYTVGAFPADWTQRYGVNGTQLVQAVAGSFSGKALRITKASTVKQFMSWDTVPLVADVEILLRQRNITAPSLAFPQAYIGARAFGAAGSESLYGMAMFQHTSSPTLYRANMNKWTAGVYTADVIPPYNAPAPNWTTGAWVWQRFRLLGTTLSIKTWLDGNAEPVSWGGTVVNSSFTAAGWTGIYSDNVNPNTEVDFFSVALNGKTASSAKR
ncbi:hypothetical protein X733_13685 [Mesorhizobium sp. L2C067A000]|nr:hypothetical protein X733_13685 [Mesorhizobium sp. L2C067A000]